MGGTMRRTTSLRLAITGAAAAGLLLGGSATGPVSAAGTPSAGAAECASGTGASGARVPDGSTAQEPKLYPDNEAKAYGVIKDSPYLGDGTVTVPTVFHMVSDHTLTSDEKARWDSMIAAQMTVLNDSYSGKTATGAANTPFRFDAHQYRLHGQPGLVQRRAGQGRARHEEGALHRRLADAERLRGQHRRRPARLGVLPQGLQQRPRLHRRRRDARRVDAGGQPSRSTPRATPSPTRSATG